VNGAPACPFVAFEENRDERAASPDHRHRCYAEVRPAPRALAHQEAYCLSSAFPVCPTFQDWARREAARPQDEEEGEESPAAVSPASESLRNPPRGWAAPPPWLEGEGPEPGGLSGSMADRLATGEPLDAGDDRPIVAAVPPLAPSSRPIDGRSAEGRRPPPMARPAHGAPASRRPPSEADAPSWERPRRLEAYPTLRSRISLPGISLPPLLLGLVAVVLAAVALFFLPSLLGIGGPGGPEASPTPGPSASGTAGPTGSAGTTSTPGPTPVHYVVQPNDTLSGIAQKFGLTLEALKAANPQITDINKINVGDEIVIPTPVSSAIPDAGTPTPEVSAAP